MPQFIETWDSTLNKRMLVSPVSQLDHKYGTVLAADTTIPSTTLVTPTGFSWSVGAGESWMFEAVFIMEANTTSDLRAQVNAPAGAGRYCISGTEVARVRHQALNVLSDNFNNANGDERIALSGGIVTTAAGTISTQLRLRVGTTAQTIYAGSYLKAERLA